MTQVINNKDNILFYRCNCGTRGFCIVKPQENDAIIVIDVQCPNCGDIERIVLLQYSSEGIKERALNDLSELDLSWAYINRNEVQDKEV